MNKRDVSRLAKHFGVSEDTALRKFTKAGAEPGERVLRHKRDEIYGTVCQFLDSETRQCGIYAARPKICREFPGSRRCGYYDFLSFERRCNDDPSYIPTTYNR